MSKVEDRRGLVVRGAANGILGEEPCVGRGDPVRDSFRCCWKCWRRLLPAAGSGRGARAGGFIREALLLEDAIRRLSLKFRAMLTIWVESTSKPGRGADDRLA